MKHSPLLLSGVGSLLVLLALFGAWSCSDRSVGPILPISDLAISTQTDSSVTLTWTAPGHQDGRGSASQYEVGVCTGGPRFAWSEAVLVPSVPPPRPAGTHESLTVTNLATGNAYFFRIRHGDLSSQSNEVFTTLFSPGECVLAGIDDEETLDATAGTDGNYLIVGRTQSRGTPAIYNLDLLFIKCDLSGNVIWRQRVDTEGDDEGRAVAGTPDGGFVIAGTRGAINNKYREQVWLVKVDASGQVLWERIFGGLYLYGEGNDVIVASDGGYVVCGWIRRTTETPSSLYIFKTDPAGNLVWEREFFTATEWKWMGTAGCSVAEMTDGDYVAVGSDNLAGYVSPTAFVIRISSTGDSLWARHVDGCWGATAVVPGGDGGCVVAGLVCPRFR